MKLDSLEIVMNDDEKFLGNLFFKAEDFEELPCEECTSKDDVIKAASKIANKLLLKRLERAPKITLGYEFGLILSNKEKTKTTACIVCIEPIEEIKK